MSQEHTFDELRVRLEDADPAVLRIDLTGRSSSREPGRVLVPWFAEVLKRAGKVGARVELHFERLEHFNSSTIAAVIQIINVAQTERVRLALSYDGTLRWQSLSFEALKRAMKPFDSVGETGVTFTTVGN